MAVIDTPKDTGSSSPDIAAKPADRRRGTTKSGSPPAVRAPAGLADWQSGPLPSILGADLSDHQLLLLILSSGGGRSATEETAGRLIAQFGSFSGVIAAAPAELAYFGGLASVEILALKAVHIAALRVRRARIETRPIFSCREDFEQYLFAAQSEKRVEEFRVLFLDTRNCLLADEVVARGTVKSVQANPRDVVLLALHWNATAIIIVHNHPGGNLRPSRGDLIATKSIVNALSVFDIVVHDHVIVSSSGLFSFKIASILPSAELNT